MNNKIVILSGLFLCLSCQAFGLDNNYKSVSDFPHTLDNFQSVEEFEASYRDQIKDCLDHTYGGTGGIPCLIAVDIWDRELNLQYKKLYSQLDNEGRRQLKQSQQSWIKMRNETYKVQSLVMDGVYPSMGTAYALMRAGEVDNLAVAMIKQRTLLLRELSELIKNKRLINGN